MEQSNIFQKIFSNVWTKRVVSLLTAANLLVLAGLAYLSVFYKIEIDNPVRMAVVASAFSLIMLLLQYYTRRQVVTCLVALLQLPLLLPIVLWNLGNWSLMIPFSVAGLAAFFVCKAGEGLKTVYGACILMFYLFGSLGYYVAVTLLFPTANRVVIQQGVSLSEDYRYTVQNTADRESGSTRINIEPNTYDLDYNLFSCKAKGYETTVYLTRPQTELSLEWKTESRAEIVAQLLAIHPEIVITLTEEDLACLGRLDGYTQRLEAGSLSDEELEKLGLTGVDSDYVVELTVSDFHTLKRTISEEVLLSSLTEDEFAKLGIPQEGDVLYANGEVVFRYFTAYTDHTFSPSNRSFSFS